MDAAVTRAPGAERGDDLWPHTGRAAPWLLALFLAVLWLLPVDAIAARVSLPFDPTLDRILLVGILLVTAAAGSALRPGERRPMGFVLAFSAFGLVALLSVLVNARSIVLGGDYRFAQNGLVVLAFLGIFAWFAIHAMRPEELPAFSKLLVGLASLTAVLVIIERRTGYNAPYEVAHALLAHVFSVLPSPTVIHPDPTRMDRPSIVGPTAHGLAIATMFAIAFPFAVVGLTDARATRGKLIYGIAATLIIAAALSTERKTAIIAPGLALLVIACYRPRAIVRLIPLAVVAMLAIHVVAPGALGTANELLNVWNTDSTAGRTSDYGALKPDVLARPVLGLGYASRDIVGKPDQFRILDNQYLGQLLETGVLGLLAYMGMVIAAMVVAHRAIRSGDPTRGSPALAATAACAAYGISSALFDAMSFRQAPYMFVVVAAMATVAASPAIGPATVRARPGRPARDAVPAR